MIVAREDFQAAIEAGIDKVPSLAPEQIESLRKVGRDAVLVGHNFCDGPGCPAILAKLTTPIEARKHNVMPSNVFEFACQFDTALLKRGYKSAEASFTVV